MEGKFGKYGVYRSKKCKNRVQRTGEIVGQSARNDMKKEEKKSKRGRKNRGILIFRFGSLSLHPKRIYKYNV
jgi:hypothetical protein